MGSRSGRQFDLLRSLFGWTRKRRPAPSTSRAPDALTRPPERLETRDLFALTLTGTGGSYTVTDGDNVNNLFTLSQVGGVLTVDSDVAFDSAVSADWTLSNGNLTATYNGGATPVSSLSFFAGDGTNSLSLAGDFTTSGGNTQLNDVSFNGAAGVDTVTSTGFLSEGQLQLNLGDGANVVNLSSLTMANGALGVTGGQDVDTITVASSSVKGVTVATGDGTDAVNLSAVASTAGISVDGEAGANDVVSVSGGLTAAGAVNLAAERNDLSGTIKNTTANDVLITGATRLTGSLSIEHKNIAGFAQVYFDGAISANAAGYDLSVDLTGSADTDFVAFGGFNNTSGQLVDDVTVTSGHHAHFDLGGSVKISGALTASGAAAVFLQNVDASSVDVQTTDLSFANSAGPGVVTTSGNQTYDASNSATITGDGTTLQGVDVVFVNTTYEITGNNFALEIDASGANSQIVGLTGSGNLNKDGTGTLTVLGLVGTAMAGQIDVQNGTLVAKRAESFGTTARETVVAGIARVVLDGAAMSTAENFSLAGVLEAKQTATITGTVSLSGAGGTIQVDASTVLTVDNPVAQEFPSSNLVKTGAGELILKAANTFEGVVDLQDGILEIQNSGGLGVGAAGTTVAAGATLQFNGAALSTAEQITLAGTLESVQSATVAGALTLSGAAAVLKADDTTTLTVDAAIGESGASGFTAAGLGSGVVVLTKANAFTGAVVVADGVLDVRDDQALGTAAGTTTIDAGATLRLNKNGLVTTEAILVAGTLEAKESASLNSINQLTFTTPTGVLRADANRTLTINQKIAGTGFIVDSDAAGKVVATNQNLFAGPLDLIGGTLTVVDSDGLGLAGPAAGTTVGAGTTLQFDGTGFSSAEDITLAGTLETLKSATLSGSLTLSGANAVLKAGAGATLDVDAVVSGTGFQALSSSTGEVILTKANTFTGNVDLAGGTLEIQDSLGLGSTAGTTTVGAGTTLQFNGAGLSTAEAITLAGTLEAVQSGTTTGALTLSGAAAVLQADAGQTLTIDSIVSGTGFSATGGANGSVVLKQANSFTGDVTVSGAAVLEIQDSAGLGAGAGKTTLNGASGSGLRFGGASKLVVTESIQIASNLSTLYATNDVDLSAAGQLNFDAPSTVFTVSAGKTFTLFPGITETGGTRGLTSNGAGTLVLAGANTYTGSTDVNGGVLEVAGKIGSASTPAGVVGVIGAGSTLRLNGGEIHASDVTTTAGTTLSGFGLIDGDVSASGSVAPGPTAGTTGVLHVTGFLDMAGSSVFNADLTGPAAGTGYDQIKVDNGVILNSGAKFVLNDTSAASVPAGTVLRFMDVSGGISGTFNNAVAAPINEASATTVGTPPQNARYSYNNLGDFVLQVAGPASVALDPTGGDYLLRQGAGLDATVGNADDTIEIWRNGILYFQQLLSVTTSIALVGTGFDETLTIDQGNGNYLAGGGLSVDFQGGGGNDFLGFVGGSFASAVHTLTGAGAGSLAFNGGGTTVAYSGLEGVSQAVSFYDDAGGVVYPAPTPISAAGPTIGALTFQFSAASDQILLADDGTGSNGISRLTSGSGTFTQVDFLDPTSQLNLLLGGGDDALAVSTLTSDLSAGLLVDGEGNASATGDSVLFTTNYTSTTLGQGISVTAETITAGAAGVTLKAAGDVSLQGELVLAGDLALDTSPSAAGTGDATLGGGVVTASAAGKSLTITAKDDVFLNGAFDNSGGQKVQNLTINTADDVSAGGVSIDLAGNLLQSAGTGTTTLGGVTAASASVTTNNIAFAGPGVTTTTTQNYSAAGAISLSANTQLSATILTANKQFAAAGNTLTLNLSDFATGSTIAGIDSGLLVKNGAGTLTISGANAGSTADVQVKTGTLVVTQATGLGSTATGTTTVDAGARLILSASIAHAETINLAGTLQAGTSVSVGSAASLVLTAPTAVLDDAGAVLTIDAAVSESAAGSGFQTAGAGTVVLTGANTFTGAAHVAAGTLDVRNNTALGLGAGQTTVDAGTTLLLNSAGLSVAEVVNLSGTLQALQDATLTAAGGLVLNVAAATIDVAAGKTLTVDSVVSGTGGFQRTGAGTLVLTGTNTFDGKANVAAGAVELRNNAALGDAGAAADTTVAAGASLVFNSAGLSVGETINLSGTLQAKENATLDATGALTLVGTTTIDVATGKTLQIDAAVGGAGGFQETGGGTLILTSANTFSGKANVTAGVLEIRNGAALGATGAAGDTTVAAGATLTLNGAALSTSETINLGGTLSALLSATLASGGSLVLTSATSVVDVAAAQTLTIDAVASGAGGLVKNGTGQVTLAGLNTYDGATAVNFGKFDLTGAIGNDDAAGAFTAASGTTVDARGLLNAPVTISAGATLNATGPLTLGDGSAGGASIAGALVVGANTVVLRDSDGSSLSGSATIGGGTLRATSDGTTTNGLALTGTATLSGFGTVDAQLSSVAGATITASGGSLILGDKSNAGVNLAGLLVVGGQTVVTRDADGASLANVTLNAGTLQATTDGASAGAAAVAAGGTLSGAGTVQATTLTVNGAISPDDGTGTANTTGKITIQGNLAFGATGIFRADVNGTVPGASYDQLSVTGTTSIAAGAQFIRTDGALALVGGEVIRLIDSTTPINGAFLGIAEGQATTIDGLAAAYSYNNLDDFVIQVEGPATFNLAGGDYLLTTDGTGTYLELWQGGVRVFQQLRSLTTALTLVGTNANETLTVDQGVVNFLAGTALAVDFQGGGGTDDLGFVGGTFTNVVHNLLSLGSGEIYFDNATATPSLKYSGTELVHQAKSFYTNPTPAGVSAAGPVIQNLTFQLAGTDDQAALEDDGAAGNAVSQLRSTSGAATFTTVAFRDPALQLNLLLGGGDDALTVSTLTSDLSAGLLIDGEASTTGDSVAFASNYTSTTAGQNIAVTAESISVAAAGSILKAAGDVSLQGKLTLGGDLSIDTSTAAAADGQVTLSGGVVTASAAGKSLAVTAKDDVSFGGAFDNSGGQKLLAVTITSADDVAANVAIDIAGALLQSAGTGTTTLAGVNAASASISTNNITFNGPGVTTTGAQSYSAAGAVTLAGTTSLTATQVVINKQVAAAGNQLTLDVSGLGSDVVGVDSGTLVKLGNGTLTISGANVGSTADVQAKAGTLVVSQATGLGSTATGTTTVDAGAVLVLNASIAHAETINLAGTLRAGASISLGNLASLVLTAPVAVLDDAGNVLTINAVISGTGGFQEIGSGELVLAGINTYDGATTLTNGKFTLTGEIGNGGAAGLFTAQSGVSVFAQGTIDAPVSILAGASLTATGALVLGDSSAAGVNFAGSLAVGAQTVTLRDSDGSILANTTISGGTLAATTNGVTAGQATISVGGTLSGNGAFTGALVVSGTISPDDGSGAVGTTGVLTVSGDLTISAGGKFAADVNGAAAGTQYDQIQVGGAVTLAAGALFTRNDGVGLAFAGGEVIRLITSATPITGTFNGIPEATATTIGGKNAAYSYQNLDDFVVQVQGAATVTLAGGDYLLRQNGAYLELWHGGVLELQQIFSLTTGIVLNGSAAAETVTIDQGGTNFLAAGTFTGGATFSGGAGAGDFLGFVGGNFTNVTHNLTGVGSGSLDFDGNVSRVVYSGLEAVHQARNFYFNAGNAVPAGQSIAGPVIQNLKFQLPATSDAATLQDDGAGGNGVSQLSAATFTTVNFGDPVQTLTVLAGAGDDTIAVNTLTSDLTAGLTIDGEAGAADVVAFGAAYNVATATVQNLTVTAETIQVNAAIGTTTGGAVSLTASTLAQVAAVGSISTTPPGAGAPGAISVTAVGTGAVSILGSVNASAGPAGAGAGATGGTVSITAAAGDVTIGANISSTGGSGATGGGGGSITISSATGGVLGTAAATVSSNGGAGTATGGSGGSIVVSAAAGAVNAPNLNFSAAGAASLVGGNGGSVNVAADGAVTIAAVSTKGGVGSAGGGGSGGAITIGSAATDSITTGNLDASGGTGNGAGFTGGNAGGVTVLAGGNVSLTQVVSQGGVGATGASGGTGGAVSITSSAGSASLNSVASGSGGGDLNGGSGGAISILAETTITIAGGVSSQGGYGLTGVIGNGGHVTIGNAATDSISVSGAIAAYGGGGGGTAGGAGGGVDVRAIGNILLNDVYSFGTGVTGGVGGVGGAVSITSSAGSVGAGSVLAFGGNGPTGGAGAAITIAAETTLDITGQIQSYGGAGSAGSGGAGGLVTLGTATTDSISVANTIDARGGAATGAGFTGGKGGAVNALASGNVSLAAVDSRGGPGASGASGGAGGSVSITSSAGSVGATSVAAGGGSGDLNGGAGAAISIVAETTLDVTGGISSAGGAGVGGAGAAGGLVTLGNATTDSISVGNTIDASGGGGATTGGVGGGAAVLASGNILLNVVTSIGGSGGTGAGGAGGAVSITSSGGSVSSTGVFTYGNNGASGGAGGALSILAETSLNVSGAVSSAGGGGSAGAGGAGGLVTLGTASTDSVTVSSFIDASGGDGTGGGFSGGKAGGVTVLSVGDVNTSTIDSSGGVGTGGANGGAGAAVSVTSSAAFIGVGSVSTVGGDGVAGGAGAAISLVAETNLFVGGTLFSAGGDGSAGNGGAGGLVTLGSATSDVITLTGAIDVSGGDGVGAGFSGGKGGGATILATGAVNATSIVSTGGDGTGGANGGAGGAVSVSSTGAGISLGSVRTTGGDGAAGGAGAALSLLPEGFLSVAGTLSSAGGAGSAGSGGAGGLVTLGIATTDSISVSFAIDATGGDGTGAGFSGGKGGGANIQAQGSVGLTSVDSGGGTGVGGAIGGAGGALSITSSGSLVTLDTASTSGGGGTIGGAGAALSVSGNAAVSVSGSLVASGGDGSAGSGGAGGLVTVGAGAAGTISVTGTVDASGGDGTGAGNTGGKGGGATVLAGGGVNLTVVDSSGGVGGGGSTGGAGGAVSITSSTASVFMTSATAAGGNGTTGGAGQTINIVGESFVVVTSGLTATGGDGSAGNGGAGGLVTVGHATTGSVSVVGGPIDASGGSAVGAGFTGGAGGGATVTAVTSVLLSTIDASGGVGTSNANGGGGGAVSVSASAGSASLASATTAGGSGANGGTGAAISIQATGGLILVTGALVSAGGDGSAGNGGVGGAVVAGNALTTSLNVSGGIDASGGSAVGAGKIGGQAGGATLVASGLVILPAAVDSSGGDGTGGASGGAGKSVSITSTTNSVSATSVDASGGNGAVGGGGHSITILADGAILVSAGLNSGGGDGSAGSGGKAGLVTLGAATTDSVTVNAPIDAGGGTAFGGGQNAGAGGGATIQAVGAVTLSSVDASGGAGSAGANGGSGGAVSIVSSAGDVATLGVTSAGGTGANGGAGQSLSIVADGAVSVTGDVTSLGGVGAGGAGGSAGVLTLGSATTDSVSVTGTTSAHGGAGTTVGGSGAAVSALATGAITLHLVTASGGDRGGSAGSVTIDSGAGPVAVDSVFANGGQNGGASNAGAILLESGAASAGTITLNGNVSAVARAGGAAASVVVNGALVLNPAAVKVSSYSEGGAGGVAVFNGTVDSGTASSALSVVADGGTVFARQVGATKALASLVVSDNSPFTDTEVVFLFAADAANASVRTLGDQTYNDVLSLGAGHSADTRFLSTGGAVFLNKDVAIGGGSELFLDTAVQSQFNGATVTLGGVGVDGALTLQKSGAATSGGTTLQGNGDIAVLGTNQPLVVQGTLAPGVNNSTFSSSNRDWIGAFNITGSGGGSQTFVLGPGSLFTAELAPSLGGSAITDQVVVTNGTVVVQGTLALRIDMDTGAPFPPLDIEIPLIIGSVVQTVNNFDIVANGQTVVDAGVGGAFEFSIYDFDGQVTPDSGVLAILNIQYLGDRVVLLQQRAPEQVDLEVVTTTIVPQVPLVATLLIPVDRSITSLRNEQLAITGGGVVDPKTLVNVEILELPDFRYASDEADPGKDKQVRVVLPRQTIRMEDLVLILQKLADEPFGVYRITISYVDKKGAKPQVIEIAITAHNRDKIRRRLQSLANLQELNLPPDLLFADEVVLPNVEAPAEQRPNRPDEAPAAPAAAPPAAPATGGEAAVPLKDASVPGRTTSLLDDMDDDADEMVQSFAFFGLAGLGASLLSKTDRSRRKRNWEGEIDAVMDRFGDARRRR